MKMMVKTDCVRAARIGTKAASAGSAKKPFRGFFRVKNPLNLIRT